MLSFRPLPRTLTKPVSYLVVLAWVVVMAALVRQSYARPAALATDLARYGSQAVWRGVYYRGERLIWHYGHWGTGFSALFLKVPARHLTLIAFANRLWA